VTFEVLTSFDGGLSYVKRWVAAEKDNGFSPGNGNGAALT